MILDIIVNIYNKEKTLLNLYNKLEDELNNIKHRYFFVDNASTDKSLEILKNIQKKNEAYVKIISLSKKHDKESCIYAGISNTKHELICIYDTDLNANVSYISKMYDTLKNNKDIDSVCMYTNYKETNFIKKCKLKLINKVYDLNIDNNKTYYRMFRRNVLNAIISLTNNYQFNNYSFEMIGFNTKYINFDNSKSINEDITNYICFSQSPFNILISVDLILLSIFILLFILSLFKLLKISNIILLFTIILVSIINIYLLYITSKFFNKQKTYFTIKSKIGFDEEIL